MTALHLSDQKCEACEGGVLPLTAIEIEPLQKELQKEWQVVDDKEIRYGFEFKDFKAAISFVDQVAEISESEGHHPNIYIHSWNKVRIELTTHAIGGLSKNDFILAAKIENIFK